MGLLFQPLDAIISSRSKVRLLRVMMAASRPISGREAARKAGIARVPAARSLDDLVMLGILQREELPGQHLYTLNVEHRLIEQGLKSLFQAEFEWVGDVFSRLRGAAGSHSDVLGMWIFGSAARGEDRPDSDLDVLVAVRSPGAEETVYSMLMELQEALKREFGLHLSPVVMSRDRLASMHREKAALIDDVLRDGRSVLGSDLEEILS